MRARLSRYRFGLEARRTVPRLAQILVPVAALAFAFLLGGGLVAALGRSPLAAFDVYVLAPLADPWSRQEVLLKATPLILIAIGLLFCFRAGRWNIGAEGQFVIGGLVAGGFAIAHQGGSAWLLPVLLVLGMGGGALWAAIPALLRNRFGISEILTSLMLVYVAELLLDYLVRGPWRDPKAFNFPQTVTFDASASLPLLIEGGRLHIGLLIAGLAAVGAMIVLGRTLFGFSLAATGEAPRAANFAGFDARRTTLIVFLISGGLAGLAGAVEVLGQIGQLKPSISQGHGFTAIIIAFLGRLTPIGAVLASLVISLLLIGSETAQIVLKLSFDLTRAFMGLLLLTILAGEALLRYRPILERR